MPKAPQFTDEQKKEAIRLHILGKPAKDIVETVGCSLATFQIWKKKYKDEEPPFIKGWNADDEEDDEEEQSTPVHRHRSIPPAPSSRKPKVSFNEFTSRYWQTKSVSDMMDVPKTIDETVQFVNNVLEYAYDRLTD